MMGERTALKRSLSSPTLEDHDIALLLTASGGLKTDVALMPRTKPRYYILLNHPHDRRGGERSGLPPILWRLRVVMGGAEQYYSSAVSLEEAKDLKSADVLGTYIGDLTEFESVPWIYGNATGRSPTM
ncbi:hypothetical protein NDU88_002831 [Pleurodeles waltl]|uniref:Uncharacterized protein n=1 Tax=Pleurodeles waltl TaxID=8319 RepID=A0AAV7TP87_PLEWA|nr:hypothetical protein NDU88_002831 [Pleurodeles waltl]